MPIKRYEVGVSENYIPHWDIVFAIKEFIQNNIYSEVILEDKTSITHNGKYAIIKNSPSGFDKGKLLVGEGTQKDIEGSPGNFSEGLKMAMLVARRNNAECYIKTNGFIVRPEIEPSTLDNTVNVLTYYIEDSEDHEGTTVIIECTQEQLDKAKSYFAVLQGIDKELTTKECIIPNSDNLIFVNGVKIVELDSILSYNFTDFSLMNRDRTSVNMPKIKQQVRRQITRIQDVKLASEILQKVVKKDSLLESQAGIMDYECDLNTWKLAAHKTFGKKVAIALGDDNDTKARYKNFKLLTSVPDAWRYFFVHILNIPTTDYINIVASKPKNINKKPKGEESANLGWAKRLIKLYVGDYGTVKVSETVYDEHGNTCDGIYDTKNDVIWIKSSILESKKETFKTLLHETIHRLTGASDNTPEFTKGFEEASYGILMRGKDK